MDYLGINGDTEKQLMSQGQEQADLDTEMARQALQAAGRQGQQSGDLTATASYGDYIAARRKAQADVLRSTGPTGNPYEDAIREVLSPQFSDRQTSRDTSLRNQYQQAAGRQALGFAERETTRKTNKALDDSITRQKQQMTFTPGQTKAAFDEERKRNAADAEPGGAGYKLDQEIRNRRYWGPGGLGYGMVHRAMPASKSAAEGRSGDFWGSDVLTGLSR